MHYALWNGIRTDRSLARGGFHFAVLAFPVIGDNNVVSVRIDQSSITFQNLFPLFRFSFSFYFLALQIQQSNRARIAWLIEISFLLLSFDANAILVQVSYPRIRKLQLLRIIVEYIYLVIYELKSKL